MWGMGFRETCPPRAAVVSPPIFATNACAASWHVVEKRKTTYEMNPVKRTAGERSGIDMSG